MVCDRAFGFDSGAHHLKCQNRFQKGRTPRTAKRRRANSSGSRLPRQMPAPAPVKDPPGSSGSRLPPQVPSPALANNAAPREAKPLVALPALVSTSSAGAGSRKGDRHLKAGAAGFSPARDETQRSSVCVCVCVCATQTPTGTVCAGPGPDTANTLCCVFKGKTDSSRCRIHVWA
jgi:hypothetical protein